MKQAIDIDQDLLSFEQYVATKTPASANPIKGAGYLWSRYLLRQLSGRKISHTIKKPSLVARFNDGVGVSGISLSTAMARIGAFLRGDQE